MCSIASSKCKFRLRSAKSQLLPKRCKFFHGTHNDLSCFVPVTWDGYAYFGLLYFGYSINDCAQGLTWCLRRMADGNANQYKHWCV